MHWTIPTTAKLLPGSVAAILATFASVTHGQSILGPPSEANHFIETPKGWAHPKTPWGEPDIQATLNMMQAAGVPLERCASSYRAYGPPGSAPGAGPGAATAPPAQLPPPCDMNKKWLTEEEYAQRMEALRTRIDASRQFAEQGNLGRAMMTGLTDPAIPQRQT